MSSLRRIAIFSVASFLVLLLLASCRGLPAPTPTQVPASPTLPISQVADTDLACAEQILALAKEYLTSQRGFRGGPGFSPLRLQPSATYAAPDRMLLEGLGGDFSPNLLIVGNEAFFSDDGLQWRTSLEVTSSLLAFSRFSDPRTVLAYARHPELAGEEAIESRQYRIVRVRLDTHASLDALPEPQPLLLVSTTLPTPSGANGQTLEGLGYEVFASRYTDTTTWDALKAAYHISISEFSPRPGAADAARQTTFAATVQGASSLGTEVGQELEDVLKAYGADPAALNTARVTSQVHTRDEMYRLWDGLAVRLWIDPQTGLLRRMALEGLPQMGEGAVSAFWGFGENTSLEHPGQVMDARKANVLEGVVEQGWQTLTEAAEAYYARNGHYPDELTPETLGSTLDGWGLDWPANPFWGTPMRNAVDSPGDFHYTNYGNTYKLSIYGWDHVLATKLPAPAPPEPTPTSVEEAIAKGLDQTAALSFPIPWLGPRLALTGDGGLSPLTLTEAKVCPPERACVWPVLLSYATEGAGFPAGGPAVLVYVRGPGRGEEAEGEPVSTAGGDARMRIENRPLPYDVEGSAWQALVWLRKSVARVYVVPLGRTPDRNPFSNESSVGVLVRNLQVVPDP